MTTFCIPMTTQETPKDTQELSGETYRGIPVEHLPNYTGDPKRPIGGSCPVSIAKRKQDYRVALARYKRKRERKRKTNDPEKQKLDFYCYKPSKDNPQVLPGFSPRKWAHHNGRSGFRFLTSYHYADWFFKHILGAGFNRLPKDSPLRDIGLTLDVPKVIEAMKKHGHLSVKEQRYWDSAWRYVQSLKAEYEASLENT